MTVYEVYQKLAEQINRRTGLTSLLGTAPAGETASVFVYPRGFPRKQSMMRNPAEDVVSVRALVTLSAAIDGDGTALENGLRDCWKLNEYFYRSGGLRLEDDDGNAIADARIYIRQQDDDQDSMFADPENSTVIHIKDEHIVEVALKADLITA